jgi:shikimate dehydrogenase
MATNYKEELIGVFGHPVAENPTVVMHEAAFKALDLNWRYLTIEVLPENLENAMKGLRAFNMRGINLTIPHKVEAIKYLDEVSQAAGLMGAVNTVVRIGNKLKGENTDGKGFMRSLTVDSKVDPKGKNVVVLGAGGAARAIAVELALAGAGHITIVNRSESRGQILTDLLNSKTSAKTDLQIWNGNYTVPSDTDIFINATSIGLFPNVNDKPEIDYRSISPNMLVCDVIIAPLTPFLAEAEKRGAKILDGLGMLVYQGAIGFKIWTGIEAPVAVMHKALSKAFGIEN